MPNVDPLFVTSGPETVWEREQTNKAIGFLHGRPHFDEVLRRVLQYRGETQPPRQLDIRGRTTFMLAEATASAGMAILRSNGKTAPTVLFQIGNDEASRRTQIDFMAVSRSGRFIAVGTSDAGSEETLVRVLDARTGKDLGDRSYDVRLGQLVWLPDDTGYLYMRGRGRKAVALQDQLRDLSVGLHVLGRRAEDDAEVVGSKAPGKRIHAEYEYPYPSISPNGRDVVISVRHNLDPDLAVFTKTRETLLDGKSEWRRLYEVKDHVLSATAGDGRALVVRNLDDDHYALEAVPFGKADARQVLYTSEHPLEEVISVGKDTYVVENEIATKRLVVVRGPGEASRVALPQGTSVWPWSLRVEPSAHSLVIDLRAWTEPRSWWVLPQGKKSPEPIPGASSPHKGDDYEVRSMEATARDGERIPLTVVGSKGQAGVAPNFVWVTTYGSFGRVHGPLFNVARRLFLEYGGAFVWAHVRGGREKGRRWHEQAMGTNKIKTVEDLIDSVKFLRSAGFGRDGGIFVSGASAGGIPVGGLLVREPKLADAVLIEAGVLNVSQQEVGSAIGMLQKQEFGSSDTPEGARAQREIDVYSNVRDGVAYPATLLFSGVNDVRVPRWQSSKLAARLQQATTGSQPILLRLSGGGHVGGSTRTEDAETDAELLVFALSNLKHPEFQ